MRLKAFVANQEGIKCYSYLAPSYYRTEEILTIINKIDSIKESDDRKILLLSEKYEDVEEYCIGVMSTIINTLTVATRLLSAGINVHKEYITLCLINTLDDLKNKISQSGVYVVYCEDKATEETIGYCLAMYKYMAQNSLTGCLDNTIDWKAFKFKYDESKVSEFNKVIESVKATEIQMT